MPGSGMRKGNCCAKAAFEPVVAMRSNKAAVRSIFDFPDMTKGGAVTAMSAVRHPELLPVSTGWTRGHLTICGDNGSMPPERDHARTGGLGLPKPCPPASPYQPRKWPKSRRFTGRRFCGERGGLGRAADVTRAGPSRRRRFQAAFGMVI